MDYWVCCFARKLLSKTGCEFAKPVADGTREISTLLLDGQGIKADYTDARLNEAVKESSESNLYVTFDIFLTKFIVEYRLQYLTTTESFKGCCSLALSTHF